MEIGRVERLGDSALDRSEKFAKEGLTFDDVLLVPAESGVLPNDVSTATRLTRTIVKEFTGISDPYEVPEKAEVVINTAELSAEEAAQEIILHLEQQGFIGVSPESST